MIVVASAGRLGELCSLIGEHGFSGVVGGNKNIFSISIAGTEANTLQFCSALTLVPHSREDSFSVSSSTGVGKKGLDGPFGLVERTP